MLKKLWENGTIWRSAALASIYVASALTGVYIAGPLTAKIYDGVVEAMEES